MSLSLGMGLGLPMQRGDSGPPELISNGKFTTDVSGWSAIVPSTIAWNPLGHMDVTVGGPPSGAYTTFTTEIGKTYRAVATSLVVAGSHLLRVGNGGTPDAGLGSSTATVVPTEHTIDFVATGTTSYVYLRAATAGLYTWDDVSVKLVL